MKCKILIVLLILKICYSQQSVVNRGARIYNGTEAGFEDITYQVSIRLKIYETKFGDGHICGGTLIGPNKVLTAAYCLYDVDRNRFRKAHEFSVVMGTMNRYNRIGGTIESDVTSIDYMDTFDVKSRLDDVGLMFLKTHIPADEAHNTIVPIELTKSTTASDESCRISGWGLTRQGVRSDVLLMANVSTIQRSDCLLSYGTAFEPGMICAGFLKGGTGACLFDTGGPLVHNNAVIGIFSYAPGCAQAGYPGIYADVDHYRDWIVSRNAGTQLVWSTFGVVLVILANLLL